MDKIKEENNTTDNCHEVKPLTDIEYYEYMSKKTNTIHTIEYPDGSKGELNRGVIVLL